MNDQMNYGNLGFESFQNGDYDAAFAYSMQGAQMGDPVAMNNLAFLYANGYGVEENPQKSFIWQRNSAECGNKDAYYDLACDYLDGFGTEINVEQARYWAQMAVDTNASEAAEASLMLSDIDSGAWIQKAEAQKYYEEAGVCYENGDYAGAFEATRKSAELGNADAMMNMYVMYTNGEGIEADQEKAFAWALQAGQAGNSDAYYALACAYTEGEGCELNIEEAKVWAKRAAEADNEDSENAKTLLASLEEAQVVESENDEMGLGQASFEEGDYAATAEHFQKAAEAGDPLAMNNLAYLYATGSGVEQSEEEAFAWGKRAAEAGYIPAYYPLATNYRDGVGVDFNAEEALHWAKMAAQESEAHQEEARQLAAWLEEKINDGTAALEYGMRHAERGELEAAVEEYRKSAEMGNAYAMQFLANCYNGGNGVAEDKAEAFAWMKRSAEAGNEQAYFAVAAKYYLGEGCDVDMEQAKYWAEMTKEHCPKDAQHAEELLRVLQETPDNGEADFRKAAAFEQEGRYREAMTAYQISAGKGNVVAMNNLSVLYFNGNGAEPNKELAFTWMKKAAEGGFLPAYYVLACKYYTGDGTEKNHEQAKYWAEMAAANMPDDRENAEKLLRLLAEQEKPKELHPIEYLNRGSNCYQNGDMINAFENWEKAAQLGNATAMNNLSFLYATGQGTVENREQAFVWMKKAAEAGNVSSFYPLAVKYYKGDGTDADADAALSWAKKAEESDPQNKVNAQALIKELQSMQENKQQQAIAYADQGNNCFNRGDYAGAVQFWRSAAQLGDARSMNNLSCSYATGKGVEVNRKLAFVWMKNAAELGYVGAYYPLACKYYNGDSCEKDLSAAKQWAMKAINEGAQDASNARALLQAIEQEERKPQVPAGDLGARADQLLAQGNYAEALPLYRRAAELGNGGAANNLSFMLATGKGTEVNQAEAFVWMKKAAELGTVPSYYTLACKYFGGSGCEKNLEEAARWAKKSIEANSQDTPKAQSLLQQIENETQAVSQPGNDLFLQAENQYNQENYADAMRLYQEAAELGNGPAANNLSFMLATGKGTEVDRSQAFVWMKKAAEIGFAGAFYPLACKYYTADGCEKDADAAKHWAEECVRVNAADANDARQLLLDIEEAGKIPQVPGYDLADQADKLLDQENYTEALPLYRQAAELGNAGAANNLSFMLATGKGTDVNKEEAFVWMKKAAELGFVHSYYPLACKYYSGIGCPQDNEAAKYWAQKAVDENAANADQAKGLLQDLEKPRNVKANDGLVLFGKARAASKNQNYTEAVSLYRQAAELGNADAANNLSVLLATGQGTPEDQTEAFYWMQKAAQLGCSISYMTLAKKYYYGKGCEKDLKAAKYWADIAVEKNAPNLKENQEFLNSLNARFEEEAGMSEEIRQGLALYEAKNYREALRILEEPARMGNRVALRLIGLCYFEDETIDQHFNHAYSFLEAAAYRQDQVALYYLTHRFVLTSDGLITGWKQYGQMTNLKGCNGIFTKIERETRSGKDNPLNQQDAKQAMMNAAKCLKWESRQRQGHRIRAYGPEMRDGGNLEARKSFATAMRYGNIDAYCGMAENLQQRTGKASKDSALSLYQIAAYLGHPHAMYALGQYYDGINPDAANECYKCAARWGYYPAVRVCQSRNIAY